MNLLKHFRRSRLAPSINDWNNADTRKEAKKAVIFVHGLGSDATTTWSSMLKLCLADQELSNYAFFKYEYPTSKLGFRFWIRLPDLESLSQGLLTELRIRTRGFSEIIVIAHSMGGLVVRKSIVDEISENQAPSVKRALLLGTPNTGAGLAIVSSALFPNHPHNKLLKPYSRELTKLNDEWIRLKVSEKVDVKFAAGGLDQIVSLPSAKGVNAQKIDAMLIGYDHFSITKPIDLFCSNYLLVKHFIETTPSLKNDFLDSNKGNPLFEVYTIESEDSYLIRSQDAVISDLVHQSHVWIIGPSGCGKTAALTRSVAISGSHSLQIYLGGYANSTPHDLMNSIYKEIIDRIDREPAKYDKDDMSGIIGAYKSLFRSMSTDHRLCLIIEEIPLPSSDEYAAFGQYIHMLMEALESAGQNNVRFFLTSIIDPTSSVHFKNPKFRSKTGFVHFGLWGNEEIALLATKINEQLLAGKTHEEISYLVKAAGGSPRFVKSVFRKIKNRTLPGSNFIDILEATKAEMI